MPKTDKKVPWLKIIGVIAAIIVVPPTFRSCQMAERSLEQSKMPEQVPPQDQGIRKKLTPLSASPRQIMDDINSRPSLQQRDVINGYKGNFVDWLLELGGAQEEKDGSVHVLLRTPILVRGVPTYPVIVSGTVSLSDYPWLRVTPDGSEVWVQGIIRDIDLGITLDNLKLELNVVGASDSNSLRRGDQGATQPDCSRGHRMLDASRPIGGEPGFPSYGGLLGCV